MPVYRSKIQNIEKKCSENFTEYFSHSKNRLAKCVSTKIKKMVVLSKPSIKITGLLLLIVKFVESSDQTIIQILRKKKSILMFLINLSNCFTGMYCNIATSKMRVCVVLLVCGLQSSTNVSKNFILGVAEVLDPPLGFINVF